MTRRFNGVEYIGGCKPFRGAPFFPSGNHKDYFEKESRGSSKIRVTERENMVLRRKYFKDLKAKNKGEIEYDPKKIYSKEDYYKFIEVPNEDGEIIRGIIWNVSNKTNSEEERGNGKESKRFLNVLLEDGSVFSKRLEKSGK